MTNREGNNTRLSTDALGRQDKTTYAWDANNRLIQMNQSKTISSNTGNTSTTVLSASFSYDAFGRRIQSTITQGTQAPTTVQYLYEGAQALGEIRDGKLSHRLLTGLSLDETIARIAINADGNKEAANSRIYLTDALNSVIAQLADDDNANIQNSYAYSPYGQSQTVGPDSANNPNQYTSRENDNTGLYYYRARYYDPVLKRFVSSDPIGLAGGINTYLYANGSPLLYADPLGLFGWADMPAIPQPALDFGTGIADDVSFGLGPLARDLLDVDGGVDRCSTAYKAGQYGTLGLGLGRMAHAGTAKAVSLAPSLTGREASVIRNSMKRLFRGPFAGSNYRMYSYEQMLAKKGSDATVKAAAGRTSRG
ncbi:Putative deoxyribonuclease RhsC [Polaromonas vacuolata]|uniref:Deoxyribonuclease RhsC n=1 Tax=Polaromonas vacuolata TaxID=37448 RepID=A0A6H2H7M3_9BURK|nr:RHS repeat-associated core domain-containing protein [Polaromonas vacuolata]QJC55793.1 Putative deoxyribonuclease RhsC [Polaromonas vacuolata]